MTARAFGPMAAALVLAGCVGGEARVAQRANPIIYGADDRVDYFDVTVPEWRARMAASIVALIPKSSLGSNGGGYQLTAPSWGDLADLCPGTRFADQPAAALCTGVLVDWDLVLTADHCVRALALDEIAVVFGYFYRAPGALAIDGVGEIASIVDEALDPDGVTPRLDYAWLRLRAAAPPPHAPAPIHLGTPTLAAGDQVISIGTGGGLPFKLDAGGTIQDPRSESGDYFIADTDTFEGSSGGGAFDGQMALLGTLARGGADFVPTADGCNDVAQEPDGTNAQEQFTYASRAAAALCAKDPASSDICRADCQDPCLAGPRPAAGGAGGCAVAGSAPSDFGEAATVGLAAMLIAATRRSKRSRLFDRDGREELPWVVARVGFEVSTPPERRRPPPRRRPGRARGVASTGRAGAARRAKGACCLGSCLVTHRRWGRCSTYSRSQVASRGRRGMLGGGDRPMKVRPLDPKEAESVVELWRLAEATPSVTDTPAHVRRAASLERVAFLVAELDGQLIGTIIATFDGWRGNLYRMAVHRAYRRRGVARRLVAAAEEALARWGARRVTALVDREQDSATGFWRAVGYAEQRHMGRFVRTFEEAAS